RFPDIIPIPGVKLGLANIFTVYAVYRFTSKEVMLMLPKGYKARLTY
ncbi:MAG: Gx transporter family protein, partial [Ruminococcus sp.]|nr:Gx transporter family protein [Ruminococcus sp.]